MVKLLGIGLILSRLSSFVAAGPEQPLVSGALGPTTEAVPFWGLCLMGHGLGGPSMLAAGNRNSSQPVWGWDCSTCFIPKDHSLPSHACTEQDIADASKDPSVPLCTAPSSPVLRPLSSSHSTHLNSKLCLLISERPWPLLGVSLSLYRYLDPLSGQWTGVVPGPTAFISSLVGYPPPPCCLLSCPMCHNHCLMYFA